MTIKKADPPADPKPPAERQQATLQRIQAALLADRLSVVDLTGESTGTDPYNSTEQRPARSVWGKRPL